WLDGYRMGRCTAIAEKMPVDPPFFDMKVLYITAGIGVPYPALDQAILEGLNSLVREVHSITPSEESARIANQIKPDLVLVLNGVALPTSQVAEMRNLGIKTAIWFTDDPYYTDWTESIAPF